MALSDCCSDFVNAINDASRLEEGQPRLDAWRKAVLDLRHSVDRYCAPGYPVDYGEEGVALRSGLRQAEEAGGVPEYRDAIERLVNLANLVRAKLDSLPPLQTW